MWRSSGRRCSGTSRGGRRLFFYIMYPTIVGCTIRVIMIPTGIAMMLYGGWIFLWRYPIDTNWAAWLLAGPPVGSPGSRQPNRRPSLLWDPPGMLLLRRLSFPALKICRTVEERERGPAAICWCGERSARLRRWLSLRAGWSGAPCRSTRILNFYRVPFESQTFLRVIKQVDL